MKKILNYLRIISIVILFIWLVLSIWAEAEGPAFQNNFGKSSAQKRALIVFDADPFYNLDEQVCNAFAQTLADSGWFATVATVPVAKKTAYGFNAYIICANTYNWAPDRAVQKFIKQNRMPVGAKVVAITLGSGSTLSSKRKLDRLIQKQQYALVDSKTFWLLRPNDETRMNEKNTVVAVDLIKNWAAQLVIHL